jgi:hypothetical protein
MISISHFITMNSPLMYASVRNRPFIIWNATRLTVGVRNMKRGTLPDDP